MIIGIPREIKTDERRISLTPDKVELLVKNGHRVLVETEAGVGAGFEDQEYKAAGASIVSSSEKAYGDADMVVKVKEPLSEEFSNFREGQIIFTYLHLAAAQELGKELLATKVTGIAYETVVENGRDLPLLYPMSEIAGKLAPLIASRLLQSDIGSGKLLSSVPGIPPCNVAIVGGGTVGLSAAWVARGIGANVTVADINLDRLRQIDTLSQGRIRTAYSTPANITEMLTRADVLVGAVLLPGARAPRVVTKEMIKEMPKGSIVIDVAIDQGGSVEGIRPTTHSDPTYERFGVLHYAVQNIPGIVAQTSSISLSNATYPYVLRLANEGVERIISDQSPIVHGLNTYRGHVTHPAVAEVLGHEFVAPSEAA